jgi:hypothetical protein
VKLTYATSFWCDACGVERSLAQPITLDAAAAALQPKPEGWGLPDGLHLRDASGQPFSDICTECLRRPFVEVVNDCLRRAAELGERWRNDPRRRPRQ